MILSVKNRLNNLKGLRVSMLEGRLGKPWLSELLIWSGLNLGNGQGLGQGFFAIHLEERYIKFSEQDLHQF